MTAAGHQQADPLPADAVARRRAGAAIRRIGHAVVGHAADDVLIDEVADTLEHLSDQLDAAPLRQRPTLYVGHGYADPAGGIVSAYDDRPFSGLASPWGADLTIHRHGDEIEATFTLHAAHEGAPGRSHGGIVAGIFDDVFGYVLGIIDTPAFTGELTVRYERPTPLHRPLVCSGRLDRREGRKLWIVGELVDTTEPDAPVVARGTGLFITVNPDAFGGETQQLPAPTA